MLGQAVILGIEKEAVQGGDVVEGGGRPPDTHGYNDLMECQED